MYLVPLIRGKAKISEQVNLTCLQGLKIFYTSQYITKDVIILNKQHTLWEGKIKINQNKRQGYKVY